VQGRPPHEWLVAAHDSAPALSPVDQALGLQDVEGTAGDSAGDLEGLGEILLRRQPVASLKDLMARLGHSSTRAALIYQHATRDRDQAIAKALGGLVREVRPAHPEPGNAIDGEA
jgi:hypothetical protein